MIEGRPILKKGFVFWSVPALGAIFFIWMFQSVLLPFVIGIALAYLLNPLVNALHRGGIGRPLAALLILLVFLAAVAVGAALAVPLIIREVQAFFDLLPGWIDQIWALLAPYIGQDGADIEQVKDEASQKLPGLIANGAGNAAGIGKTIAGSLLAGGVFVSSFFIVALLAPIAAYFMIKEWPSFTRFLEDLIPPRHRATILGLLQKMDGKISGFVRGQLIVAATLAVFYAITLFALGLNYGILLGLLAGFLNLVPLLGSIAGLLAGVLIAWAQTGDWQFMGIIALVFLSGQALEGYILTPKLVGESVGMHPLWVFFAVLAGGSLAGIVGMLIAIPLAACLGVLLEFLIQNYKDGSYYNKKKDKAPVNKAKRRGL